MLNAAPRSLSRSIVHALNSKTGLFAVTSPYMKTLQTIVHRKVLPFTRPWIR